MHFTRSFISVISLLSVFFTNSTIFGDEKFENLIKQGEYLKAIEYAEKNIPAESRTIDIWLNMANAHEKAGSSNAEILACYKNAQTVNPSDPLVYIGLANCALYEKNYEEAIKHYQRAYILKRSVDAAEGIAIAASKLKNWEKARDAAESAVSIDTNVIESRLILIEIYRQEKDYISAAEQLEFIVKKEPTSLKYWKRLAVSYEKSNLLEKLKYADPQIIKLDKKDIKSRQRHAEYLMSQNDINSAFPLYKELAILTPNDAVVFKNLYQITKGKGEINDAILYLRNHLALDSSNAVYHKELGDLLFDKKDFDGALESYRRVLRTDPKAKGFYKKYEKIVLEKKLIIETIKVITGAINAKEADAESYIALGDIYKTQKKYIGAAAMYTNALKTDTKNVEVLSSLGDCQAKSNKTADAIVTYEQVILLNPNADVEHKILGDLQMKLNKTDNAMSAYKKYLTKVPSGYDIAITIGFNEYDKKDFKKTIDYLEMVKENKLHDIKFLLVLGDSYYQSKNYKKSAETFAKIRDRKVSANVLKKILKPLGESYEKIGDKAKAADAYLAYTQVSGVKDADASYMKAYLREDADKENAVKMYESNINLFPADNRNFLRLGLIYSREKGTLINAATMLNKAALLSPNDPVVWSTLGEVYEKLNNEKKELNAIKKFLAIEPQNLKANRRVGMILLKEKSYTEAIINLEIVSTSAPKDVEVMESLAEGYLKTNRPEKAIDLLVKAKDLKPDNVDIRTKLIKACKSANKKSMIDKEKDELAKLDRKIIAKDNKNIDSRARLADYAFTKNDLTTSYKIYKELSVLTPKNKLVFKRLNEIAIKSGKKKEAVGYLQKYLALDPKNAKAHIILGNLLYEQKDHDGALESYRRALKIDPKVKGFYKRYGEIVVKKGLETEAINVLNQVVLAGEADAGTYITLGEIYQKMKNYVPAIKMFQKASEADPKNSAVLTSLAECQAVNGNVGEAVITYEQVILINPDAKNEFKALGELKMKQNKEKDAIKTYKMYLTKVPNDNEIAKTVGLYEYNDKDYQKTIQYLEMVKDEKLKDIPYFTSLGLSYYQLKHFDNATVLFENARKVNPPVTVLTEILKPLAECYENTAKNIKAADAYLAYTKLPGVKDADASYKSAYLREKTDKNSAIDIYMANVKVFTNDHRNFLKLGILYAKDKATLSESAAMLNKASIIKPDDSNTLIRLGKIYGELKNEDLELITYKKLLKFEPQSLLANRRVGLILLKQKKYSEAIINLEMVSASEPNDLEIMLGLSEGYMETKRPANAIELLAKAKNIKKNDPDIGLLLYKLYKQTGKSRQAESEIKELISLTKDNKLRVVYAKDLIEKDRYDEANSLAQQIKKSDPTNIESLMLLGKIQQKQNKLNEAIETYKMISFINEKYAPALCERGCIYLLQSNSERAESFFGRALEADPKYALAHLGLAKVAKSKNNIALYKKHLNIAKTLDPENEEILIEIKGK